MRFAALALVWVAPIVAGTIEGRVTNSVTGEAVAGVAVRFVNRQSHVFETSTDATGAYRLPGLADGEYRGEFSKDGFSDYRQGSTLEDLFKGPFPVRVSGDVPARVDAQLEPWGGLRGRVVDEDGKPAAKVAVEINRNLENTAVTDENGEFSFPSLPPGSYTVVAKPKARVWTREGEQVGAVPIYYPAATQPAGALPVHVAWGADVTGLEIRLKSVPVHRVAGVVLDADGKPAARAVVRLLGRASSTRQAMLGGMITGPGPPVRGGVPITAILALPITVAPGPEPELAQVETRGDGTFEFAAVEPGDWRLSAEIDLDQRPRSGVASATVGDQDVEGVEIRMSGPFSVEVTADWGDSPPAKPQDGRPVPTGHLVHLTAQEGQPIQDFNPEGNPTSVNGAFPGRYRVMGEHAPDGTYTGAVMFGGQDVLGQVVEVTPGAGPLQAIVRNDGGSLRGLADPGAGATVFLISRSAGETLDYLSAACGPGGAFEFKNVAPGDYYLVAFDHAGPLRRICRTPSCRWQPP